MPNPSTPASTDHARYRPDPARETQLVIDAFLGAVASTEPDHPDLIRRIRRRHQDLISQKRTSPRDAQSWTHLKVALVLVAAYEELRGRHDDEVLVPRLELALVEPLRPYVAEATRAALDAATDPFSTMVEITKERERVFFGPGFVFDYPVDTAGQYVAEVRRCEYHEVLAAYSASQLTPILCAFDANWIDAIDPHRHGFSFERPTTIGTGGVTCPFRFTRAAGATP